MATENENLAFFKECYEKSSIRDAARYEVLVFNEAKTELTKRVKYILQEQSEDGILSKRLNPYRVGETYEYENMLKSLYSDFEFVVDDTLPNEIEYEGVIRDIKARRISRENSNSYDSSMQYPCSPLARALQFDVSLIQGARDLNIPITLGDIFSSCTEDVDNKNVYERGFNNLYLAVSRIDSSAKIKLTSSIQ